MPPNAKRSGGVALHIRYLSCFCPDGVICCYFRLEESLSVRIAENKTKQINIEETLIMMMEVGLPNTGTATNAAIAGAGKPKPSPAIKEGRR